MLHVSGYFYGQGLGFRVLRGLGVGLRFRKLGRSGFERS